MVVIGVKYYEDKRLSVSHSSLLYFDLLVRKRGSNRDRWIRHIKSYSCNFLPLIILSLTFSRSPHEIIISRKCSSLQRWLKTSQIGETWVFRWRNATISRGILLMSKSSWSVLLLNNCRRKVFYKRRIQSRRFGIVLLENYLVDSTHFNVKSNRRNG